MQLHEWSTYIAECCSTSPRTKFEFIWHLLYNIRKAPVAKLCVKEDEKRPALRTLRSFNFKICINLWGLIWNVMVIRLQSRYEWNPCPFEAIYFIIYLVSARFACQLAVFIWKSLFSVYCGARTIFMPIFGNYLYEFFVLLLPLRYLDYLSVVPVFIHIIQLKCTYGSGCEPLLPTIFMWPMICGAFSSTANLSAVSLPSELLPVLSVFSLKRIDELQFFRRPRTRWMSQYVIPKQKVGPTLQGWLLGYGKMRQREPACRFFLTTLKLKCRSFPPRSEPAGQKSHSGKIFMCYISLHVAFMD